jgi:hypothetical protein
MVQFPSVVPISSSLCTAYPAWTDKREYRLPHNLFSRFSIAKGTSKETHPDHVRNNPMRLFERVPFQITVCYRLVKTNTV